MTDLPTKAQFSTIGEGFSPDVGNSQSLKADAYVQGEWFAADQREILAKSWQWVCHVEKLRTPGSYVTIDIAGQPIAVVRDREGALRAFYNVCKHRAHALLHGEGEITRIMCPYHAWVYKLDGQLVRAPETEHLEDFNTGDICLD